MHLVNLENYLFSLDFKGIQINTLIYRVSFIILEKT